MNFRRWKHALGGAPHIGGWVLGSMAVFAALVALLVTGYAGVASTMVAGLAIAMGAAVVFLVRLGLKGYDVLRSRHANAVASKWVRDGDTADEVRRRKSMLDDMGAMPLLDQMKLDYEPPVNMNNWVMMQTAGGAKVDMMNNLFGQDRPDHYSVDAGNGMDLMPGAEYQQPIGLDNDTSRGSGTSASMSAGSGYGSGYGH